MKRIETYDYDCPNCKGNDLEYIYKDIEFNNAKMYIPFICNDCGLEGREIYSIEWLSNEAYVEDDGSFVDTHAKQWLRIKQLEKRAKDKYIENVDWREVIYMLSKEEQEDYHRLMKEVGEEE